MPHRGSRWKESPYRYYRTKPPLFQIRQVIFLSGTKKAPTHIVFSSIGYGIRTLKLDELKQAGYQVALTAQSVELSNITVSAHAGEQYKPISRTDIAMRGVYNSQEVLRIIPGIVIGQHQGGGKAEQIFLRGFDCDHGTISGWRQTGCPLT